MIHINLLGGERRASKAASVSLLPGQKVVILAVTLLLVTVIGLGWRYWALSEREESVAREIVAAQREEGRLAEILKQVQEFEARQQQQQQRVSLINELKRGQSAPVHMIDQVSRALPDMLWLTSMKQQGYDVTMEGRCLSLTALSDFVGNLEASRYFQRPVEILDSQVEAAQGGGPELITFSVKGTFQMSGIDASTSAEGGKPSPRKGAPRG